MEEMATYSSYKEYKAALDRELSRTAEGFVRVGYLLKIARDTDILKESGYRNLAEFAAAEYSLDESMTSRFININTKFSEGGYSDRLLTEFQGYGYTKLAIMLTLPDVVNEVLTPEFSKADINTIKKEIDAENKVSDLEVLCEQEDQGQQDRTHLEKVIWQAGREDPELYTALHKAVKEGGGAREYQEILAPAGESIRSVRISGIGRILMAVKDVGQEVVLVHVRSNERELYPWEAVVEAIGSIMFQELSARASWETQYEEPFPLPEKQKLAPVQPEKEKKAAARKVPKVTPAKPNPPKAPEAPKTEQKVAKPELKTAEPERITKTEPEITGKEPEAAEPDPGEIPGQTSIEEHPEWLPDNYIKCHDGSEVLEKDPDPDCTKAENAKVCPFCGGKEIVYMRYQHEKGKRYRIICCGCMAGIDPGWAQSREAVLELWNRRVKEQEETSDKI